MSPRPTELEKARARIEELEHFERDFEHEESLRIEVQKDRDAWRAARLPDPEAEALAGCVRAIEEMRDAVKRANERNRNINVGYGAWSPSIGDTTRPTALDSAEGRILLALAARYGLAIEATVPKPQPPSEGDRVVMMPAHLADKVERMFRDYTDRGGRL